MGETKTPKITAIFVGGDMDPPHYDDLKAAQALYPSDALLTSQTPESVPGILSFSPVSKDSFLNVTPKLIRQHGSGGILEFIQLGHGFYYRDKPQMILDPPSIWTLFGNGDINGEELPLLFEKNIPDPAHPPYLAIILGGCFSGGFAKYFLQSKVSPDFFYGNSPPQTVGFQGLRYFFDANVQNADSNHDDVVTLRERAVHQMNRDNPLAVMFSKRGSPDLDIAGNSAQKPYFEKSIVTVASQEEWIKQMEALRFGEQAVVMVEGSDATFAQTAEWFEKEAIGGDGFYRFFKIRENPQSVEFFGTGGKTGVFVVGPNLRYHGIALKTDQPIGDQIPRLLAEENPLWALKDWQNKIAKEIPNAAGILQGYKNYLNNNPTVQQVKALLASKNEKDWTEGLKLAELMMNSGYGEKFSPGIFIDFYNRLRAEKTEPSLNTLIVLTQILGSFYDAAANETLLAVVKNGLDRYGAKYKEGVEHVAPLSTDSLLRDLYSGDSRVQMRALSALELADSNFYINAPFLNFLTSKIIATEVKHALNSYFERHAPYVEYPTLNQCIKQFHNQEEAETKAILLNILIRYVDEPGVRVLQGEVSALKNSPNESLHKSAANFLSALEKADEARAENLKAEKKAALDRETWAAPIINYQAMARGEAGRWTGGFLVGVGRIFKKGILSTEKTALSVGVEPVLDVAPHWKHGWVTLLPSVSGLVDFKLSPDKKYQPHHSHITVAGGYAARYMPARSISDIAHGWMGELDLWNHDDSSISGGPSIRYFNFPNEHDQILTLGAKLIFAP